MAEDNITIKQMLDRLCSEGLVGEAGLRKIETYLSERQKRAADPVYIRLLSGFGAWVAAPFLFGFLILIDLIGKNPQSMLAAGVISLASAVILAKIRRSAFLVQFALALSFAGHLLILYSLDTSLNYKIVGTLAIAQILLCLLVYPFFKNAVYRFAMPLLAVALVAAWIFISKHYHALHILVAFQTLSCGGLFLWKKEINALKPLNYVFAVGLPATVALVVLLNIFEPGHILTPYWPSTAILASGMVCLLVLLAGGLDSLKKEWMVLAIAVSCLLGAFTTPGVLVAIGLLVLGYGKGDKILTAVAFIFLPVFLVLFYYALDVSLLNKSYILAGSGMALLLVRWALKQRPWARELAQ